MKNVNMDDYVGLIDDLRHVYSDNVISGPVIDDMVSFLANCPVLVHHEYTLGVFKQCCLCLGLI